MSSKGEMMNYKYSIRKLFVSGHLQGIEITERTNVRFMEGQKYGSDRNGGCYIITDVMELE